jgi:aarF domain-containing kinase
MEADPDNLTVKISDPKSAKELSKYAQQYLLEISSVLSRVPRETLLLLKTNDCLRSIDRSLSAPVNTFVLTGRYSVRAIQEHRLKEHPGLRSWFKNLFETLNL